MSEPSSAPLPSPRRFVARVALFVLALLFVLSTGVQHNDPDPVPWMLVYGTAAVLCFAAVARPPGRVIVGAAVALGFVATLWACTRLASLVRFLSSEKPALAFHMKTGDADEEGAREGGGLVLVVGAAALIVAGRRVPTASRA